LSIKNDSSHSDQAFKRIDLPEDLWEMQIPGGRKTVLLDWQTGRILLCLNAAATASADLVELA
jgi:hypothetical protein